jgi:4-amino-4-deoxy-L-arabinose transferase-like glycosyltransferase
MLQGRLPVWSPGSYAGAPFAADSQAAVFYPLRWLTILLSVPWGFTYYALELEALGHVWLAGAFTYALAYALTRRRLAGLLGAVAFGLGGYLTSYPLLQLAVLESITWLPLALLLVHTAVHRPCPLPWLVGAGLALGLAILAGHPQTGLHVAYVVAAYYLFLSVRARRPWRWILGLGVVLGLVALGSAAVGWLPTAQFMRYSTRRHTDYAFVAAGLPLVDYLQTVLPRVLSFWVPEYGGLATLVLAVLAWWGRRAGARAQITFWALVGLVAGWLALGDAGILFELAYRFLPGIGLFRQQERWLGIVSFAEVMLAVQGLALWLGAPVETRRTLLKRATVVVASLLAGSALFLALAPVLANGPWLGVVARQAGVLAVIVFLLWAGQVRQEEEGTQPTGYWCVLAIILLLFADLYVSTYRSVDRRWGTPAVFWPQPAWIQALREALAPARLDSQQLFPANVGEAYGLEDIRGISPLQLQSVADLAQLPRQRRWQLLNVTHVVSWGPLQDPNLTQVAEIKEGLLPDWPFTGALYHFDAALPRAWMTYRARQLPTAQAALQALAESSFDPAAEVLFHTPVPGLEAISVPREAPAVRITRPFAGGLDIRVQTTAAGYLVLSEWHYPGWQATLDGRPAPLYPADYALQALYVPAGEHEITLRFFPTILLWGGAISTLTLLAAAVLCWRTRRNPIPGLLRQGQRRKGARRQRAGAMLSPFSLSLLRGEGLLLLVLLGGLGLRLFRLGFQELRGDEAFSYLFAFPPAGQIITKVLAQGDPHSPLHYLLLHAWMSVAGTSEFALRFPSLIMGVLLLPVLAQLGRQLGGRKPGLLLASLAAGSQSLVWLAQDVRNQYLLAITLTTLATLWLARLVQRPRWHGWLVYALLCALTVYSHYYGLFALAAHGLYLLAEPAGRKQFWPWVGSALLAALLFAPWLVAVWPYLMAAGQLSAPDRPDLARHLVEVGRELTVGPSFGGPLGRWVFLGALFLAGSGARELLRRNRPWGVLLVSWLVLVALGIWFLRLTRQTFNAFYISLAAPAWWALVGTGIIRLGAGRTGAVGRTNAMPNGRPTRSLLGPVLAGICILVLLGANGLSLKHYYFDPAFSRSNGYRQVAAYLAAYSASGDVFIRNGPDPCFDYYLDRAGVKLPRAMEPESMNADPAQTARSLQVLAEQYERLWFVHYGTARRSPSNPWDPQDTVMRRQEDWVLPEQEVPCVKLKLFAFRPRRMLGRMGLPAEVQLDELLRLERALLMVDGQLPRMDGPIVIFPHGAAVRVTLAWRGLNAIPEGYTVFVHLLGADGRLITQHDGWPAGGQRPTFSWSPGDLIVDPHDLSISREVGAQTGTLVVGLYNTATLQRQALSNGQDTFLLARVRIE